MCFNCALNRKSSRLVNDHLLWISLNVLYFTSEAVKLSQQDKAYIQTLIKKFSGEVHTTVGPTTANLAN